MAQADRRPEGYSPGDAPFFFLHAGAAVELLLKAALCAASPALLIDSRQGNEDSLIRLVGYLPSRRQAVGGDTPRHADRPPYTIGLAKAIDRYELLYGPAALSASQEEFDLLKVARDLAAHGAGSREVTEDMHRVLVTLATVVDAVLPHVGVSPGDFWGHHADLIAHAMEEQRDKVAARARTLISAARQRFEAKYAGIPEEALDKLMVESFWLSNPQLPEDWDRVCPACGARGISRVRPEIMRQAVSPYHRAVAGFKAIDFRCSICNLVLESEELVDAAVDFEAWEEAYEDEEVDSWAEQFGIENLTRQDQRNLGFE